MTLRTNPRGWRARPCSSRTQQDHIEKQGDNTIVFAALTGNDIDGFNFKPDKKVTSLRFVLEINGRRVPQRVEIGRANQKARALPLGVKNPEALPILARLLRARDVQTRRAAAAALRHTEVEAAVTSQGLPLEGG